MISTSRETTDYIFDGLTLCCFQKRHLRMQDVSSVFHCCSVRQDGMDLPVKYQ